MRKLSTRLIIALLTFLLGIAATTAWYLNQSSDNQGVRLILPKAHWEPIFFEAINPVAKLSGQSDLREVSLPEGNLEIRTWWGFGLSPLEGITIKRIDGRWSAIHVKADNYYAPNKAARNELRPPKSGWETCWKRLVDGGILTLPDASEIQCDALVLDGISYVVEINTNRTYRTYRYGNPQFAKCDEAEQMIKIVEIIREEFRMRILLSNTMDEA